MKKAHIFLVLIMMLDGSSVVAQRPVGDTILMGSNSEYIYDSMHLTGAYLPTLVYNTSNPNYPFQIILDGEWMRYWQLFLEPYLWNRLDSATVLNYIHAYPNLSNFNTGRHITGCQFATPDDDIVVKGLAVCPTIINTEELLECAVDYRWRGQGIDTAARYVIDTTLAGRETEYVQLYTIEGGQPQLQAEGGWRIEHSHRHMLFPRSYESSHLTVLPSNGPVVVPLYEAMFDTSILIEADKVQHYMLAFTHNNNNAVWSLTANDTVFPSPNICWEHYPIAYSYSMNYVTPAMYDFSYWIKYDTFPWYNKPSQLSRGIYAPNIFPILDTLFGTPCAAVTGLQTVEADSLWATLMWSADARQHEWEVAYRPADDSLGSDSVVTVSAPTVTLTGLTPGTVYSVRVRGLCDIENYSPWSDTLQFVTTFTPPDTTPDTLPWIHPWIHPHTLGIGNLDRYTRIMPNPAHDMVSVFSSYQLKGVTVYDLSGRQMLMEPADGMTATVNVAALPRGTYILAIRTLQGVATKRLLVE